MADAEVLLFANLFSAQESQRLLDELRLEISWKQEFIRLYGKVHALPRLTAWYGEPDATYSYSGIENKALPWTPTLTEIRHRIERVSHARFNSVLLNLYRDGMDSMAWHADDEPELGANPAIGSVSFGASRPLLMKHRTEKSRKQTVVLDNGSFLLMKGSTQHYWLHSIAKSRRPMGERINLTFRFVS
jgi:alkylated DNA repair dioxygenase AlkB